MDALLHPASTVQQQFNRALQKLIDCYSQHKLCFIP